MRVTTSSIIEGLVLLGRTKEQAIEEIMRHERMHEDEKNWKMAEQLYDEWVKNRS